MKIINNCEEFRVIDLLNQYDDLYFEGLNISAHPYRNSLVIVDLANAIACHTFDYKTLAVAV